MNVQATGIKAYFHNKLESFKESGIGQFLGRKLTALSAVPGKISRALGNFVQKNILDRPCMRFLDSKNYVRLEKLNSANAEIFDLKDKKNVLNTQVTSLKDVNSMLVKQRNVALEQVSYLRGGTKEIVTHLQDLLQCTTPVVSS